MKRPGARSVLLALALTGAGACFGQATWLQAKAWLAQSLLEAAWRRTIDGESGNRPWPWADTWPVARLTTPGGDDLIVLHGVHGQALAFGPGHLPASALPGQDGVIVMAGHRDSHFSFLEAVRPGQVMGVQGPDGMTRRYRVSDMAVVDTRVARLEPGDGPERLVLVTCYPFRTVTAGGPLRYVVTAVPEGGDGGVDSVD